MARSVGNDRVDITMSKFPTHEEKLAIRKRSDTVAVVVIFSIMALMFKLPIVTICAMVVSFLFGIAWSKEEPL